MDLTRASAPFLLAAVVLWAPVARAQTLTAGQAVARALAHDPGLRAANYSASAAASDTQAAARARNPALTVSANGSYAEAFAGTSVGVTRNLNRRGTLDSQVGYTTDVGTALSLDVATNVEQRDVNRDPGTSSTVSVGPTWVGQATLQARQPLLRGAGTGAVLAPTRAAQDQQRSAEQTRDDTAGQLVLDTLNAYWELWYAQKAAAVEHDALTLAEQQYSEAQARVQLGTYAPADALQFQSQLATARANAATADANVTTRALALAHLVVAPVPAGSGIRAVDTAPSAGAPPPVTTLLEAARASSAQLLALQASADAAQENVTEARDANEVQLDFVTTLGVIGVWQNDTLPGLQLPGNRPAYTALAGLELGLPLGPSTTSAQLSAAAARADAAQERYRAALLSTESQVASLRAQAVANQQRIDLLTEAARVAHLYADAQRKKLQLGTTTPLEIVAAQQSEQVAQLKELRSRVDFVMAVRQLEYLTGSLLSRYRGARAQEANAS